MMRLAFFCAASSTTLSVISKARRARVTSVFPSPTKRPQLSKLMAEAKGATASIIS